MLFWSNREPDICNRTARYPVHYGFMVIFDITDGINHKRFILVVSPLHESRKDIVEIFGHKPNRDKRQSAIGVSRTIGAACTVGGVLVEDPLEVVHFMRDQHVVMRIEHWIAVTAFFVIITK